jgi:ribosomal RNA-processing protein 7
MPVFSRLYTDPSELRKKVDSFLLAYDQYEAEQRRKSKEKVVDDDGFTLVKSSLSTSESTMGPIEETRKRKNKAEDLKDFYAFQLKERKISEWKDTKKQEASDKAKFNEMKISKKFQL